MAEQWGSVYQEKGKGRSRYWRVQFRLDGKRYTLRHIPLPGGDRLPLRDEPTARALLEAVRAEIRGGKTKLQALAPYITGEETLFAYHWRRYVAAKGEQSRHGRQLAERRAYELTRLEPRGYLDDLLEKPVLSLTYGDLEDWMRGLFARGLSPKTVKNAVADVGTCLRWLARRGDLPGAPELPTVHVPEYVPRVPTPEELDAILSAVPEELRGIFLARGRMGLRPSEATRANVQDWNAASLELTLVGKGGLARVLPAHAEVAEWITAHRSTAFPLEPLFPNPRARNAEKRWTEASARTELLKAMDHAGTDRFRPNEALRHAFATHRIATVGKDLLSPYLGHRDQRTTDRYARISSESLRPVVAQVAPKWLPSED